MFSLPFFFWPMNISPTNNGTLFCFIFTSHFFLLYYVSLEYHKWLQHKVIFFSVFAVVVGKFFDQVKEVNFYFLLAKSFETIMNSSWFFPQCYFCIYWNNIFFPFGILIYKFYFESVKYGKVSSRGLELVLSEPRHPLCPLHPFGFPSLISHLPIVEVPDNCRVTLKC